MAIIGPHKGWIKKPLDIVFSSRDIINNLPNDHPLYIGGQINDKPTNGILIDLVYGENVITNKLFLLHDL